MNPVQFKASFLTKAAQMRWKRMISQERIPRNGQLLVESYDSE